MSIPKTSAWSWNIYLGSNLIAEWNCWQWRPSSKTYIYYPFKNDIVDQTWNSILTLDSNVSYSKQSTWYEFVINKVWTYWQWYSLSWITAPSVFTWSCYINIEENQSWSSKSSSPNFFWACYSFHHRQSQANNAWEACSNWCSFLSRNLSLNTRYNICISQSWWVVNFYINWQKDRSINKTLVEWFEMLRGRKILISEVWVDLKLYSDDYINKYFNSTKSNYWL